MLRLVRHAAPAVLLAALAVPAAQAQNTLTGWARMPANTFADGPTTGQFASSGFAAHPLPLANRQSVQGFSAILGGPVAGSYLVMPDNGFGAKGNSADALLRMVGVRPDFRTAAGGSGTVSAIDFASGAAMSGFTSGSFIGLRDPDGKLSSPLVASQANYPGSAIPVDASIRAGRLLTGADFDIEAVRQDKHGNLWFGDEFGPFLLKTDATGKVLRSEIALPGVFAPENPFRGSTPANLGGSRGFEGMAINPAGDRLYTLLEGTVVGDPAGSLRIDEFDIATERFGSLAARYRLDPRGTNIGDMTAISDHEFLVIERNGSTATSPSTAPAPFKKIFRIDIAQLDADGFAKKTEVVDLMDIADPFDLDGDGQARFTFPYVTIESVLILDANTLLVVNDNNYPGGGGRGAFADDTEFLRIQLASPIPEPSTWAMLAMGLLGIGVFASSRRPT